jgi:hypothetical protein
METITIGIPNKEMRFEEIMKLHGFNGLIPSKYIINKKIPGLGATTNEIESERNSIIIAPFTALIEVKKLRYESKLFALYGEYDTEQAVTDLLSYLNDDKVEFKKIMTTPESFFKVKLALTIYDINYTQNFFMLFDECDVLIADALFRSEMLKVLPDFFSFKDHSFISATPIIPSDIRFDEFGFKHLVLEPQFIIDQKLRLIVTNNINSSARDILSYCSKIDSNPVFIFTNCKTTIAYLAKLPQIVDDYKIYCSERLRNEFFGEQGFKQVFTSVSDQSFANYNFLTSRFFSGVDMLLPHDIKPHILMISNVTRTPHSIIHPNITALQIYGRCRGGITSITHLTTIYKEIPHLDENAIEQHIDKEIYHLNELRKLGKKVLTSESRKLVKDLQEKNHGNIVFNDDGTINPYYRDNYLSIKLTENIYTSEQSIVNQYNKGKFFKVDSETVYKAFSDEDINNLKKSNGKKKAIEVMKQIHSLITQYGRFYLGNEQQAYQNHLYLLQKEDPLIFEAYFLIGPHQIAQLKFNRKAIRGAIYNVKKDDDKNHLQMIDEVINSFRLNEPIYIDKIETILSAIYAQFGYKDKYGKVKKAKGSNIEQYFEGKRINGKRKINGVYRTYYILYKEKYKLSSEFYR